MFPSDPENRDILNPKAVLLTCFSSSVKIFSKYNIEKLQNQLDFAQYLRK